MASASAQIVPELIHVAAPCLIVPAEDTPHAPLFLSNYDQQGVLNMESLHYYPPSSNRSTHDVVEVIRNALARLLVPYHFAAGRLRLNEAAGRVEVDCNRAGALFAEAQCQLTFEDLQDKAVAYGLLNKLILHDPPAGSPKLEDAPLLTVQVTMFKCGGFVIGISRNHALVGGPSGDEFLKNFTSLARGEGLQIQPVMDRSLLKARVPAQPQFEHFEYTSDVPADSYFSTSKALQNLELYGNFGHHVLLWNNVFTFSSELLNTLKQRALADGSIRSCTTFEALAACVWQAKTRALDRDPRWLSKLLFPVDCRKVLTPPLPAGFTGNTFTLACARMQSQELQDLSFPACVKQVQEAKARITDAYVRSSLDWLELNHGAPAVNDGIYLTSWMRFGFRELDFGWGTPVHTHFIPSSRANHAMSFLPNRQRDGIDVCMALEQHQAESFQKYTGSSCPSTAPPPQARTGQVMAPARRSYSTYSRLASSVLRKCRRL